VPRRADSRSRRSAQAPAASRTRSGASRDAVAAGTRRRILDATISLLAEGSYASTSISAICGRSGLPPTSIYWHFKSKEGLLAAVTEEGAEQWFRSTFEWEEPRGDPLEGLSARLEQLVDLLVADPPFLRLLVMLALERRRVDDACIKTVRRVRKRATDRLARWFAAAFSSQDAAAAETSALELATFALAMFDGVMLAYQIDPTETDLRQLLAQQREALLALAQARGAEFGSRPRTTPRARAAPHATRTRRRHGRRETKRPETRLPRRLTP
jgi:AcrR family transcriptional regulator